MFRQLNWEMPIAYRQENIRNNLSCDWQIYIECNNCKWEERLDPSFGVISGDLLKSTCKKCGHSDKHVVRHSIKVECMCQECSQLFEKHNISNLNEITCPNCTSKNLSLYSLFIIPEFPEKFGELIYSKEKDWGVSGADDGNYIIKSLQYTNMLSDRELYFLPAIKICERLRLSSKYPSDYDLGLIWNVEANLLRDYFKATDEIIAGIDAIDAFQESIKLTNEPIQRALVIHNLAMICYSLLVKHPQDFLSLNGAPENLKELGINKAFEALKVFETGEGSSQPYSAMQVARIHHLIGDLYKVGDYTNEDLKLSIAYLEKALQEKELPERLKAFILESRSIAISKMTNPSNELKKKIEPGLKKVSERVESDRAYSEKWSALYNLSLHYWNSSNYDKALKSIEDAAAKAIYDLENTSDISTLELRSRQFVDIFKVLVMCYVKFEKGLEALIVLEKFRALILKHRILGSDNELIRKNIAKIGYNPLIQLLTNKVEHVSIKKLSLPKDEFNETLKFLEHEYKNIPIAFVSISVFEKTSSAILLIINKSGRDIKTFQWENKEEDINILSNNLLGLMHASVFNETRMESLKKISSLFFSPAISNEINKGGVKRLGISIQSLFNLYPYEAIETADTNLLLVDKFEIFYFPSLQIIHKLSSLQSNAESKKMLIIPYQGNDLKYSTIELNLLKQLIPNNVTVFKGNRYPKNELLSILEEDFDFIHFICHGTFDPIDPLKSALILNEESGDSGKLFSREILELKFKKSPVISLSACSSGLTSFDKFETYSGLTGSFLQAGAKGILGSRSEIPDELGSNFMLKFYDLIFTQGCSILESINKTQLYFKNENKHWASFSYLGMP